MFDIETMFPDSVFKELREDEYPDKDGYPLCKKCNTTRVYKHQEGDKLHVVRVACKCQAEANEKKKQEEQRQRNIEKFRAGQKMSMLGSKYLEASFKTAKRTAHNKEAYEKCINYSKNAPEMIKNGFGLYIYGDNSSGKTHLTACLCNELVELGYSCIYTSVPRMLAEIQQSYSDDKAMGQARLTTMLEKKSFVFIDDLGKEFLGREGNSGAAKFAEKVLLEVLNARHNNGKPVIFSSNYSISELAEAFQLDKAIIERINVMATRVIKLEGDDFRDLELKEKSEALKKLGI